MRKLVKRKAKKSLEIKTSTSSCKPLLRSEELFLELLMKHHLKRRYQYMKDWWLDSV